MNYVEYRYKNAGNDDKDYDGCPVEIREVQFYKKAALLEFNYDFTEEVRGKKLQDVDFAEKRRRTLLAILIFHHFFHLWLVL